MAPDHSRSSTLGSSGAPPGSPGAVLTGAGSMCTMATLLPIRSASQRKHVSDLLAMSAMTLRRCTSEQKIYKDRRELAAWPRDPPHGWTWNHVRRSAPTKWWLSAASKVPSRWAPRAWWSPAGHRRSRVLPDLSPPIVRPAPPAVRPSWGPLGRLASHVAGSGAAAPRTPPMTVWDACGEHVQWGLHGL